MVNVPAPEIVVPEFKRTFPWAVMVRPEAMDRVAVFNSWMFNDVVRSEVVSVEVPLLIVRLPSVFPPPITVPAAPFMTTGAEFVVIVPESVKVL